LKDNPDPANTTVVCRTRDYAVDRPKIRAVAELVLGRLGVGELDLTVSLVGSRAIRTLNRDFRGIDRATDVLSFPQLEWKKPVAVRAPRRTSAARRSPSGRRNAPVVPSPLGDVVISLPDAERNARKIGQPLAREVCFLLVHGILHLCGHDHMAPADERRMLAAQRRLMAALEGRQGSARALWTGSVKRGARRAPPRAAKAGR
jgi:probable rRNA maturation factor